MYMIEFWKSFKKQPKKKWNNVKTYNQPVVNLLNIYVLYS